VGLAFWLKQIPLLIEMAQRHIEEKQKDERLLGNILFALVELDAGQEILAFPNVDCVQSALSALDMVGRDLLQPATLRVVHFLCKQALIQQKMGPLASCLAQLRFVKMDALYRACFDALEVWAHLIQKKLKHAEAILHKYPASFLSQDLSPLHFPFGTWLYLAKGPRPAKAHFASVLETPYPPTTALPSLFLAKKIDERRGWIERAFWWEKKELARQLELFHRAVAKK
jgi:serine/threonine-protein kinase